jgi:hypothetical protein
MHPAHVEYSFANQCGTFEAFSFVAIAASAEGPPLFMFKLTTPPPPGHQPDRKETIR